MSPDHQPGSQPPPDSRRQDPAHGAAPADDIRTLEQPAEDVDRSAAQSLPQSAVQNPAAPTLKGYVLIEKLGEGAYGQVWRAVQARTRKEVAVKVFMQRTGLDWIFLQREVERLTRLDSHPNIVTVLDAGLDDEPPYYVMELIEGGALQKFVKPGQTLPQNRAVGVMRQICDALSYVHLKALIHCDLKPANVLVDLQDRIRVVDFGQSRVFTESAASMGTLFYMAPEQAVLSEPGSPVQPDVRWDVYALGATMIAILTGRAPFSSETNVRRLESAPDLAARLACYREIVSAGPGAQWNGSPGSPLNPEFRAIIEKCVARRVDDRYESIGAVEIDLENLARCRPVSPLAASTPYRAKKFLQRNTLAVGLAVIALALIGTAIVSSIRGARLAQADASAIVARFANEPAEALAEASAATPRVKRYMDEIVDRYVDSQSFPERIMGATAAPWIHPDSFWRSLNGGTLWRHGEWLELAMSNISDARGLARQLEDKVRNGSTVEKYAAFCLIGQLGPRHADVFDALGALCVSAVAGESDPGVVAAAWWAAGQLGKPLALSTKDSILLDELTGIAFVRVPATDAFLRGSAADDPDRLEDELRPAQGVSIDPVYFAMTEVPRGAMADFWNDVAGAPGLTAEERATLRETFLAADQNDSDVAAGQIKLELANAYCAWLNERASDLGPRRTYRLPTEDEWEYAARGGNPGRFCYGDDTRYAPLFAVCNGEVKSHHTVTTRLPNAYGLFDMHGGLWEFTSTPYPKEFAPEDVRSRELFVKRGGAYYNPARRCRSAQRNYATPDAADQYTGMRLVMELAR